MADLRATSAAITQRPRGLPGRGPYRVGQVADFLGVHRDTVQRWCRTGELEADTLPSGHYRISAQAIDDYVRRLTSPANDGRTPPRAA